jgi:hypothetical protein
MKSRVQIPLPALISRALAITIKLMGAKSSNEGFETRGLNP